MQLPYTNETITSEGRAFKVLDVSRVDFSNAQRGRKSAETLIKRAKGGEKIETRNKNGELESSYIAKAGDAIFINSATDVFVPGNPDGSRWQFDDLEKIGYEITQGSKKSGEMHVKPTKSFSILREATEENTCIKDAWGPGQHQFLFAKATLKLNDNGSVTGIDKDAFDSTWETLPTTSTKKPKSSAGPKR